MLQVSERRNPKTASLSADGYTKERKFLVESTEEEIATPEAACTAEGIPALNEQLEGYDMYVTEVKAVELEDDDTRYDVTVSYARKESNTGAGTGSGSLSSLSFDTGTVTVHKTENEDNGTLDGDQMFAKPGETAPDPQGLIGWDGEKVQGVDIQAGAFVISFSRRYTSDEVSSGDLLALARYAYRVNSDNWGGSEDTGWIWSPGEVLFKGAQGKYTSGGKVYTSGDSGLQFSDLDGLIGVNATNTDNGVLYLKLTEIDSISGLYSIELFKNADMDAADKVAENPVAELGENTMTSVNDSDITGTLKLDAYQFDTDTIQIIFPFPWEITYNFAISMNEAFETDNKTIGEVVLNKDKEGWWYTDVQYSPTEVTVGGKKRILQSANYVYFQKVYQTFAFQEIFLNLLDSETLIP